MAPFVKDGVYKIRNVEFSNFVAGLVDPMGPISAFPNSSGGLASLWRIKNYGGGGNLISIESLAVPGFFANADEFQGAPLVGARNSLLWTVVKVDANKPVYYLQSEDGSYVWELPNGFRGETIILVHQTAKDNTKWTFDRVGS